MGEPTFNVVIDDLMDKLRARTEIISNGFQVEDAWPGEEHQRTGAIWVEDIVNNDKVAGMNAGRINTNEVYTLILICDVLVEGGTAKDARERVMIMANAVLDELAVSKRLAGNVAMVRSGGWRLRQTIAPTGRGCSVRIEAIVSGRR